jgi:hypothetical protein
LALAKEANVSPLYLTGDTNEKGAFGDKTISEFLRAKGVDKHAGIAVEASEPAPAKRGGRPKAEPAPVKGKGRKKSAVSAPAPDVVIDIEEVAELASSADIEEIDIAEEEIILLLKSLIIRARYNDIDKEILAGIKHALIC